MLTFHCLSMTSTLMSRAFGSRAEAKDQGMSKSQSCQLRTPLDCESAWTRSRILSVCSFYFVVHKSVNWSSLFPLLRGLRIRTKREPAIKAQGRVSNNSGPHVCTSQITTNLWVHGSFFTRCHEISVYRGLGRVFQKVEIVSVRWHHRRDCGLTAGSLTGRMAYE